MEAAFVIGGLSIPCIGETSFVHPLKSASTAEARISRIYFSKANVTARFNFFGSPDSKYAEWANDLFANISTEQKDGEEPVQVCDFSTMTSDSFWANAEDITAIEVSVTSCIPVTASGDLTELTVDVSDTALSNSHVAPGQFVQLGRNTNGGRRGIFTIASPPGRLRSSFQFLVSKHLDPLRLCEMIPGDILRISPVGGSGVDYVALASTRHIYALADCPQGFAAVRSLIEWDEFKTASGSGANRTTKISLFYTIANAASLPYTSKISDWALYGVNFIPIQNLSLSDYMKSTTINEDLSAAVNGEGFPKNGAFVCVADMITAEELFVPLQARGVAPSSFFAFTEKHVTDEIGIFNDEDAINDRFGVRISENTSSLDQEMYEEEEQEITGTSFDETHRTNFEDEIWRKWVQIRDAMRSEFDKHWRKNNFSHGGATSADENAKKEAWEAWFAANRDAWRGSTWDDVRWNSYWDCWTKDWSKWNEQTSNHAWGSSSSWNAEKSSWSQTSSEEFWDHVGNTRERRNTWGSWSSSSHRAGGRGGWGDWSTGYSSSSGRQSGFGGSSSVGNIDFYAVLGIKAGATKAEIKKAYRKKALQHHPDLHPEKKAEATARMQEVVIAYMTLKDASKRFEYDRYGI